MSKEDTVCMEDPQKTTTVEDFSIDYNSFDDGKFENILKEYGVCVVNNIFTPEICDDTVDEIVSFFESLGTGVSRNDSSSFAGEKIPFTTRPGLYYSLVGNLPPVWKIRINPVIRRLFSILYHHGGDFIVSSDGFTLTPNQVYPEGPDWPHVDQTEIGKQCIQGQVVLTNTTASFICSPRSYHVHEEMLKLYNAVNKPGSFQRIDRQEDKLHQVQDLVAKCNGQWQIPVVVPKGSVILWSSSTIHSARGSIVQENIDPADIWKGWRCVVYVCLLPINQFTEEQIRTRAECLLHNRQTNHWCTSVMPKRPEGIEDDASKKHPVIERLVDDPVQVYNYVQRPDVTNSLIKELSGIKFCEKNGMLSDKLGFFANKTVSIDNLSEELKDSEAEARFLKTFFVTADVHD